MFGLVLVKVEVNGRPAVLIVDTGANQTIISSELGDMRPRTLESAVSPSKGSGWSGTGVFATATLRVGPISWRNHRVVVMDTHHLSKSFGQTIDGLLGMDFFKEFEVVVVNLKNHKLILEP
jgi:predicted aspartyl protease